MLGPVGGVLGLLLIAQSTGSIRGLVVDARDGAPVRSVSVRLQSETRTVITDEAGRFEFTEAPEGNQELYVSAVTP